MESQEIVPEPRKEKGPRQTAEALEPSEGRPGVLAVEQRDAEVPVKALVLNFAFSKFK